MKIERRIYSRAPWRLVTSEGKEVVVPQGFDHPDLGATSVSESISGDTRAECTDKALALLESLLLRRKEQP